jgi:hypothetical protein
MRNLKSLSCVALVVMAALVIGSERRVAANGVDLPGVMLTFNLQARDFRATLSDAAQGEVADSVLRDLQTDLSSHFCYVRWQRGGADSSDLDSVNAFTVSVVGEDRPGGMGQRVHLEFQTRLASRAALLVEARRPVLYESYDVQPTQDRYRFIADITDSLSALVADREFRHTLEDQFLSRIPIAKAIRVEAPMRCIVIPLPWDALRMDEGSRFEAVWQSAPPESGPPLPGDLLMESRSSYDGDIMCRLIRFFCPPVDVDASPAWDDSIPGILDRAIEGSLIVYLREYQRNPYANETDGVLRRVDR